MYVCLRKTPTGFEPDSEQDRLICGKMRVGDFALVKLEQPRDLVNHRRFFALLWIVFQNQDKYDNLDDLLIEVKLLAGHYREHITNKGELIYVPKSIAFHNMGEPEFKVFYEKAFEGIRRKIIPGISDTELRRAVENELAGA